MTETNEALVKFEANAPVGNSNTLKSLIERSMPAMRQVIPHHITADKLARTMFIAMNKNPALWQCTQSSIAESIMQSSVLGLELSGVLGESYLVPYSVKLKIKGPGNSIKEVWASQATLVPGFRGLLKLSRQSGELSRVEAECVYEKDHFRYIKGTTPIIEFEPLLTSDRGKLMGAYALAELTNGKLQVEYMCVADIEKVRQMSKAKDGMPWTNSFPEMARKTVFRRLFKWIPSSSEKLNQAIELSDREYDLGGMVASTVQLTPGQSRSESLAERLSSTINVESKVIEEPEVTDNTEAIDAQTAEDRYLTVTELADLVRHMASLKIKLPSLIAAVSEETSIPESEINTDSSTWKLLKSQATSIINSFTNPEGAQ